MKKYEKIYKEIIDKVKLGKYNLWFRKGGWKPLCQRDVYLIYTGFRLIDKYREEKYPNERLPKTTKKEVQYYENLPNKV